jgi:hypothetical protein
MSGLCGVPLMGFQEGVKVFVELCHSWIASMEDAHLVIWLPQAGSVNALMGLLRLTPSGGCRRRLRDNAFTPHMHPDTVLALRA